MIYRTHKPKNSLTQERISSCGLKKFKMPATTTIKLNVAREGAAPIWKALDALYGEKGNGGVSVLLLESAGPLIVDQPEDDTVQSLYH